MLMKDVEQILKQKGIKPSHHRMRVLSYMLEKKNHPTADMIFMDLVGEIPTLSKTTVYNTLNLFLENGVVILISINENEARYDADTTLHGHFKCLSCQQIYDIRLPLFSIDAQTLDGYEVSDTQIYFKGICPDCRK